MSSHPSIVHRRDGQTMIFLIMIVVILAFVAIWNFDLHKVLYVKTITRNAGDSAALAAARWQGITLNLIGELNVAQAVAINNALTGGDPNIAPAIAQLQGRLCFVGPMLGVAAAQLAAKNNGVYANDQFTQAMQQFVSIFQNSQLLPPAYSSMLNSVAGQGVAASPVMDNPGGQPPLNPAFYNAISSRDWCWFYRNHLLSLETWPAPNMSGSSVFFPLNLTTYTTLTQLDTGQPTMGSSAALQQLQQLSAGAVLSAAVATAPAQWYVYDPSAWDDWTKHLTPNFPFVSQIKNEYNYFGADAVVCTATIVTNLSIGAQNITNYFSSAAKPFGYLDGSVVPSYYGIVLPAFHDVRLIPVGASSGDNNECENQLTWEKHIFDDVPRFDEMGLAGLEAGCPYCADLATYDSSEFQSWLQTTKVNCNQGGHGGGGSGGGTSWGH